MKRLYLLYFQAFLCFISLIGSAYCQNIINDSLFKVDVEIVAKNENKRPNQISCNTVISITNTQDTTIRYGLRLKLGAILIWKPITIVSIFTHLNGKTAMVLQDCRYCRIVS